MFCTLLCLASSAFAYSRTAAINYSNQYALDPNPAYKFYGRADCTNFVSQCFYAGGMKKSASWTTSYNNDGQQCGTTNWNKADSFKNYVKSLNWNRLGNWSKNGVTGTYAYVNNSANLTASNTGKVVIFYDWTGNGEMDHSSFYVVNNAKTQDTAHDGNVTGDLINQHSIERYHVIWNRDKENQRRDYTRIYAFELPA